MPMTPKKLRFAEEFPIDLNATKAAKRAGYSAKTAYSQGQRLLKDVDVQAAIQSAMNARSKRVEITSDYVLRNLMEISERCMQHVPVMEFDREVRQMVQVTATVQGPDGEQTEVGVWEFDSQGALRANELMGKHLKLFTEKFEATGKDGSPLGGVLMVPGLIAPEEWERVAKETQEKLRGPQRG